MANINKELNDIKNAVYGKEVRGSIHDGIKKINEEVENTTDRQDSVEAQFQDVLDETTGKDVISAPEIIAARGGKANLGERLNSIDSDLAQTAENKENEIQKSNPMYGEYTSYRANIGYTAFSDEFLVQSFPNNTLFYHIRTPKTNLIAGQEYILIFDLLPVTDFTKMDRIAIFNSAGSIRQELGEVTVDSSEYKTYTLKFTPNETFENATVGIGRNKTGGDGVVESFKIRNIRVVQGSTYLNPVFDKGEKQYILNNLPHGDRVLIHSGYDENPNGDYAAFMSGVFFKGKEYHVYRVAAEHVDRNNVEHGYGKIMFLIRHEDGSFEKRLLDLPDDLAYRDPWIGVSPDGRYLLLKVCANEGQEAFDAGQDPASIRYLICYWVLDEELNGVWTNHTKTDLTSARHILWDGRVDAGPDNIQYHAYGSVVFNPSGHMLTTAYNGYNGYGVDVLKSERNYYLNPGKLVKTETLHALGNGGNETTLFYWKDKLCAVTRMGGSGAGLNSVFKYTKDIYDGKNWVGETELNSSLFSPAVIGSYISDEKVILMGTKRDLTLDTRRPAYMILTFNRANNLLQSDITELDTKMSWGGYPSIVKTKNGYSTLYYEDIAQHKTNVYYKEFNVDTGYLDYFEFKPFEQEVVTNPANGITVRYVELKFNELYEIYGTCSFANITAEKFSRTIQLPFSVTTLTKSSNVASHSQDFVSNIQYASPSEMTMNIMRLDKNDTSSKTVITEFRILARKI